MKRTALVHIGLEKTGSTAIQRWMAAHHQLISSAGIVMPRSLGYPNHTKLVAACLDDGVIDNIKAHHLFVDGSAEKYFRRNVFASLGREIKAAGPSWHTLLITSELISSRLSSPSELNRLASELLRYVDSIKFIIFLRRQDQLALSRFSSILRSGHGEFDNIFIDYSPANFLRIPDGRLISDDLFFYDFASILGRFESLPCSTIEAYVYGADRPLAVFSRLLNLAMADDRSTAHRHNSALSAEAQYVISCLNQDHCVQFPSGMRNEAYRKLQRRIESEVTGQPRTVARHLAHDFWARYQAINEDIAARYLNGSKSRFSTDFSVYPEFVDYSQLPDRVADQLAAYRQIAQAIPGSPSLRRRLFYKARHVKVALKNLTGSFAQQ